MAQAANLTDVAAYKDYVEDFGEGLIHKGFYTPKTVQNATVHEDVKGKKVLTLLDVSEELAVAWKKEFQQQDNVVTFKPRVLETTPCKIDLSFTPQDFESSYLGAQRKKGQNPGEDLPFEGYILEKILKSHAIDVDKALWKAVKAGSITPGVTKMKETFDGYLELIKDLVTAGNTTVPTPGGAITMNNILDLLTQMWLQLDDAWKEMPVKIYGSWAHFITFNQARAEFLKYVSSTEEAVKKLPFSMNATWEVMPGLSGSNRLIMTPDENLHVGFDGLNDDQVFQFEKNKRVMDFWLDFKIGAQIGLSDETVLVVNDLE